MTVKELIAELQKFNPESEVYLSTWNLTWDDESTSFPLLEVKENPFVPYNVTPYVELS